MESSSSSKIPVSYTLISGNTRLKKILKGPELVRVFIKMFMQPFAYDILLDSFYTQRSMQGDFETELKIENLLPKCFHFCNWFWRKVLCMDLWVFDFSKAVFSIIFSIALDFRTGGLWFS